MEARMTICNMSIEAGARAGMIAPDAHDLRLPPGRPQAPSGAEWDAAVAVVEQPCRPTPARSSTARWSSTHRRLTPVRHVGHQPWAGASAVGGGARSCAASTDPAERSAAERALEYMDLVPGTPLSEISRRHRLSRVVHQRSHRGPSGRRRDHRRVSSVADGVRMLVVPGSVRVRLQAEAEGLDAGLHRRRCRVASRRLLDVPGDEPRPARPRRAQRVHLEPQLRRAPGQGRPDPPGVAAGGCRHRSHRTADQPDRPADVLPGTPAPARV